MAVPLSTLVLFLIGWMSTTFVLGNTWQEKVEEHVCTMMSCKDWCDCTAVSSQVTLDRIVMNDTCLPPQNQTLGFKVYTDCPRRSDRVCFKWVTRDSHLTPSKNCDAVEKVLTCLYTFHNNESLTWQVSLTPDHRLDVHEMCSNYSVTARDNCHLCENNEEVTRAINTPKLPEDQSVTKYPPDSTMTSGINNKRPPSSTPEKPPSIPHTHRLNFWIGVSVGIGGAMVIFIIICIFAVYIRRKLQKNYDVHATRRGSESIPTDNNYYSTVEHPLREKANRGTGRQMLVASRQTSIEPGTSVASKKLPKSKRSATSSGGANKSSSSGPYTEYYPDRAKPCYAGLQLDSSDSALSSRERPFSGGQSFNIFAENQEPDLSLPSNIPGAFLFESMSTASLGSLNSFKLPGEYMDPGSMTGHANESQTQPCKRHSNITNNRIGGVSAERCLPKDHGNTSASSHRWHGLRIGKRKAKTLSPSASQNVCPKSRQYLGLPDGKEGTMLSELVQTLERKKGATSDSCEAETENPYAEVGDLPPSGRHRSLSHPTVSPLAGYQTYEEIKPRNNESSNEKAGPQYFELENTKSGSNRHYFELEKSCQDVEEGQPYFELERPSSLPLEKKKKCQIRSDDMTLYNSHKQNKNMKPTQRAPVIQTNSFGVSVKTPTYYQLERSEDRDSVGSGKHEYLEDSTEKPNLGNNSENTLTFYPGGRKRASTHSLEEQAYDKLNRSSRSSRRNVLNNAATAAAHCPYDTMSTTNEDSDPKQSTKTTAPKFKGLRKK